MEPFQIDRFRKSSINKVRFKWLSLIELSQIEKVPNEKYKNNEKMDDWNFTTPK